MDAITNLSLRSEDKAYKELLLFYQKVQALSFGLWISKSFDDLNEEEIQKLQELLDMYKLISK